MCVRVVLRAARISKAMLHPNVFSFRVMFDKWLASRSAGGDATLNGINMPQLISYLRIRVPADSLTTRHR